MCWDGNQCVSMAMVLKQETTLILYKAMPEPLQNVTMWLKVNKYAQMIRFFSLLTQKYKIPTVYWRKTVPGKRR